MAAQVLTRKGRQYCSSLPRGISSRILSSCQFSTNIRSYETADGNDASSPPPSPPKTHPQSFVQSDVELGLGELETHLPPGFHTDFHRKQRGVLKPRHREDGKDSYWRPPWKNPRAEIISAEDFANRPRVTFSESFASMHDAMLVLSWMSQEEKESMYNLYLQMMTNIAQQSGPLKSNEGKDIMGDDWTVLSANTSHEYVVRVVAQTYNVTTSRAAGVIQLQHNEEQMKKDPTFTVNHHVQAYVDAKVRENIRDIYQSYGETDPLQFVEQPISSTGNIFREDTEGQSAVVAPELTDADARLKKTRAQELEDARVRIKNHIYVEDVDENTRKVKTDQEANRLLKMGAQFEGLYDQLGDDKDDGDAPDAADEQLTAKEAPAKSSEGSSDTKKEARVEIFGSKAPKKPQKWKKKKIAAKQSKIKVPKGLNIPAGASPFPDNNRGWNEVPNTRRPRWKFAAQIVNTRMLENPTFTEKRGKGIARQIKGRRHGRVVDGNTIIEQDGKLRVASVAELEQTSWKHVRNESEFMFKGVKKAWLKRQLEGEVDGWGMQEEVFPTKELEASEEKETEEGEEGKDGEEGEEAAAAADGEGEESTEEKSTEEKKE